jgi:DinB superfamily
VSASATAVETRMTYAADLARVTAETLECFSLPEEVLDRNYAPGKWSVRFVLHHLADSESIHLYRIRRVISEARQVIWAVDQDAWARGLDYANLPLDLSRRLYETSREAIEYYARLHYDGSENIAFVHSETGRRTLKDEFDKVVWHNAQHLEQIRRVVPSSVPRAR